MDLSIEAIEADLALAEVNIGRPLERLALARAQVRATLHGSSSSATPLHSPKVSYDSVAPGPGDIDIEVIVTPDGVIYSVPTSAVEIDRIEAAARILGIPLHAFRTMLGADFPQRHIMGDLTEVEAVLIGEQAAAIIDAPLPVPEEDPGEIEIDDDDEDFFAEARKDRKP